MTDSVPEETNPWRSRAEAAEAELDRVKRESDAKLIQAQLKAEALKLGMIDLDGLKLIDADDLDVSETGELKDVKAVLEDMRVKKPWLFSRSGYSSSAQHVPRPTAPKIRHASELSHEEWLAARAALIKRR